MDIAERLPIGRGCGILGAPCGGFSGAADGAVPPNCHSANEHLRGTRDWERLRCGGMTGRETLRRRDRAAAESDGQRQRDITER